MILPCAALDGYTMEDPWRQRFWTELRQPMMFGHRGNGMTYKIDPSVHLQTFTHVHTCMYIVCLIFIFKMELIPLNFIRS